MRSKQLTSSDISEILLLFFDIYILKNDNRRAIYILVGQRP